MSEVFGMLNPPSATEYVNALTALGGRVTDEHRLLFQRHYEAPGRKATATDLATWADLSHHGTVNLRYGPLGREFCDQLGIKPDPRSDSTYPWWSVWSRGWYAEGRFVWQMLPNFAEALEELGWVHPVDAFTSPDEVVSTTPMVEGAVCRITVNAYERNANARRRCIEEHGTACCICGFDFGDVYGEVASGYIHVHHLRSLADVGGEYVVDPVADLRPVCPNCHAVIHIGGGCRSIEEVRQLLDQQGQ